MAIRIVRLGSPRSPGEGLRIGTIRRPPRGVPKSEHATRDFYDVWFPVLAPSEGLLHQAQSAHDDNSWRKFVRRFNSEMKKQGPSRTLDLLAALSHSTALSVGCYCADESRCHRSLLRELLAQRGALIG
jgi:uncharacterized protein YeaO (DUF488 family)